MRTLNAPKQVYALSSTSVIFGSILLAGGAFLSISGQPLGMISACGALLLTLRAVRTLSTRVTDEGVSQLTWRGRVHLPWKEVTRGRRTPLSFTLMGGSRRIVVSLEEFEDTAVAISYIEARVSAKLIDN